VIFTDMDTALPSTRIWSEYWATIPPTTTSSPRSTRPSGPAARSSTSRPACRCDAAAGLFRINTENMGQFERTLIIAEEGSTFTTSRAVHRPAPLTRCIRRWPIVAKKARVRYDGPNRQNVFNLVTKRAVLRGRDDGVGRRNLGQADDEVPVDLPARRGPARPPDRLRRRGPASGCRRSSTLRREDAHRSSPRRSPRARRTSYRGLLEIANASGVKSKAVCAPCSTRSRARTPTRRSEAERTMSTSATRPRSRRSARSRSLPPVPRAGRGESPE
jgi:hypothetical protein